MSPRPAPQSHPVDLHRHRRAPGGWIPVVPSHRLLTKLPKRRVASLRETRNRKGTGAKLSELLGPPSKEKPEVTWRV